MLTCLSWLGFKYLKKNNITLSDVAKKVGVSAITVSRALRSPQMVSEAVRQRILEAVDELGYIPDPAASALASRRTNTIGVIIPSVTNNVFSEVLQGIYSEVADKPYNIQLGNSQYSPFKEAELIKLFTRQKPAGLIITGIDQLEEIEELVSNVDYPVVQIMEIGERPIQHIIGFSHYQAARAAARHLFDNGYRKLGFLGARMDPRTQRRFQGFKDQSLEDGTYADNRVVTTIEASTVTLGGQLLAELLQKSPDVDAIFCNNDDLALGALFEAQRRRMVVPRQLGICGFNDLEMMAAAEPSITSVRTFRKEMGRQALRTILDSLENEELQPDRRIDLGFEIMARRSTGRSG